MGYLDGLLVISVEQALAAPLCTSRLADAGARVIKIEREGGDFARGYDAAAKGDSAYFVWANHNKESVVLDYKKAEDEKFLHSMIASADVFVQNLSPGALARAGFGSEELRAKYPRLITCDISGYGEGSGAQEMKAYDFLIQAETGLVSVSGGVNEIGRVGVSVCDIGAGITAHGAILEALLHRNVTNAGSGVKISLFDVAAEWMTVPLIHAEYGDGAPLRQGLHHCSIAPYGAYRTKDDRLTVISIQNEREWGRFCENVIHMPELAGHPDYHNNKRRVENRIEMDRRINAALELLTSEEFQKRLLEASIAFGALNDVSDLSHHKALRRQRICTSQGEMIDLPAPPVQFSARNRKHKIGKVPALGNATEVVRAEFK